MGANVIAITAMAANFCFLVESSHEGPLGDAQTAQNYLISSALVAFMQRSKDDMLHYAAQGCGVGSSSERTRTAITAALKKKLKDVMGEFGVLRQKLQQEYRCLSFPSHTLQVASLLVLHSKICQFPRHSYAACWDGSPK